MSHSIIKLIEQADKAIIAEDFSTLLNFYTENALLVIEPGNYARGKEEIEIAFRSISKYFQNGLQVSQEKMKVLETKNTALVFANTVINAPNRPQEVREATYVFEKNVAGNWLCSIDNSYGHKVLNY